MVHGGGQLYFRLYACSLEQNIKLIRKGGHAEEVEIEEWGGAFMISNILYSYMKFAKISKTKFAKILKTKKERIENFSIASLGI